jgi:hypothetical protein
MGPPGELNLGMAPWVVATSVHAGTAAAVGADVTGAETGALAAAGGVAAGWRLLWPQAASSAVNVAASASGITLAGLTAVM